ncbi:MAG: glycoside hydrolase family 3 C-terminal domain-containing protein [Treponemataceae bacterium]|nr:glycoside hydrolase family 3 C-terminal domain-containing protein [Treponemataceae bacterium]
MKNAKDILKNLTINEKIRLLNGVGSWNTFTADGQIPSISMSDGPHGLRHQSSQESYKNINDSDRATCFPTASCIASSWNRESAEKLAKAIAKEALNENVQIMLGCGMNIKRSPLCGRNFEYFSEDPYLSGQMGIFYVKGMQNEKVAACIKHFACNNQEKNRQSSSSNVDERTLREIYLKGFEDTVRNAHPASIMSSYNMINGKYASANKTLLTDLLRDQWGFDGIVMSDWGGDMDAAQSLKCGLDIGMPDSYGYFQKQLEEAYKDGRISELDIDKACERIIKLALKFDENRDLFVKNPDFDYERQHEIALKLALDSAVLLKNDGFFPIQPDKKRKVFVLGQLAKNMRFQGGGSSHITTAKYPDAVESLRELYDVIYEDGYVSDFCSEKKKIKLNRKFAQRALKSLKSQLEIDKNIPVLIFCGLTDPYEGEGFDRKDLNLPQEQIDLMNSVFELTDNVALVTFSGSPMDLSFAHDKVRSILQMYLCGQACGQACAELIGGRANPCGKLAESWPFKIEDTPCHKNFAPDSCNVNYEEGSLVGYRYYESKKIPLQYEFGFGLSYTTFEYSNLVVKESGENKFDLSVCIKNTGSCSGSETVQLYIKNPESSDEKISRTCIQLADFAKVHLEKGQEKTIEFKLDSSAFSVYSDKEKKFAPVEGNYKICLASSVRDIRLEKEVKVSGKKIEELVSPDKELMEKVFIPLKENKKGSYTSKDSLGFMAKGSSFIRKLLKFLEFILVATSENKSADDPAVKITIYALKENPLESLISTAGGIFTESRVNFLVRKANK